MEFDLKTVPFSRRGSYLVISEIGDDWCGAKNEAGLYLRTVHSGAMTPLIARLLPMREEKEMHYTAELRGTMLVLKDGEGEIAFCFDDPETLLIRGGKGLSLTLDFLSDKGPFEYVYTVSRGGRVYSMANCFKNACRCLIGVEKGASELDQRWEEKTARYSRLRFSGEDGFEVSLREILTEWDGEIRTYDFDASAGAADGELKSFEARMPACPEAYGDTAKRAAYLLWASVVEKGGCLPREAMLMSKNWMKNVWSWDHCFNAIALSYAHPEAAWDQFMILFDCQDVTGLLPDSINDVRMVWNFCKPPIHGWALRWMMRNMTLMPEQTKEAYERLAKWTKWWLDYRDYDGDGLCEYNHGNDSGWDNSTAFSVLPPIATPELQAFLILQMDVLSELAARLGNETAAAEWKQKSERLLDLTLNKLFTNDSPTVVKSGTHEPVPNESLLPYVSIVLGEKLPEKIRRRMIGVLKSGKFLSEHGFATEALLSPAYKSDGYWRGPIWAPSTMLLTDGLDRCGESGFAREIARRFADMVRTSGFAENFDAVSGKGLRDRAYTWTASAFLAMAHEYLL